MRKKEKQNIIKSQILEILNERKFGTSVKILEEQIMLSRNTILKYLESLKKEGKAFEWDIGKYRIWLHGDVYRYLNELKAPQEPAIHHFLKCIFYGLEDIKKLEEYDWKEFGLKINKRLDFLQFFPQEIITEFKNIRMEETHAFNEFSDIYPSFLRNILYMLGDTEVKVEPPIVNSNPFFMILRIKNSKYIEIPLFFEILCGIEESDLTPFFKSGITVTIHNIHREEKIIDLKYILNQDS